MNFQAIIRLFDFWTMLIIISFLALFIVILLVKAGPVGRFFLDLNLLPGPKTILIEQTHTNELKFRRVGTRGTNLKVAKDHYVFLSDLRRKILTNDKENGLNEKEKMFNEIVKKPAHVNGKPVYFGSRVASVGANPHLMEAISIANIGTEQIKNFFKNMVEEVGDKIKNIHFIADYSINDLAEIMNIVITEQRLESVFMEGELAGMNRYRQRDQVLLGVILILAIGLCVMGWFLTK